jgi:DNA modification methylase
MNKILQGDCLDVLKTLPDNSVDSCVTDPPYELGFMGKKWDNTGISNNPLMWKEVLRVLKPGGHLLSFSGTRTYHRMACAIEDAGFEVRDMITWNYGQGFPKSLNVFKHLQKKCKCGNMEVYENRIKQMGKDSEKETEYFLRFMQEADLSQTIGSEKERGEVLQSGLSEQSSHRTMQGEEPNESSHGREERILEGGNNTKKTEGELQRSNLSEMPEGVYSDGEKGRIHNATQIGDGSTPEQVINENGSDTSQRPQSEQQQYREPCAFCKQWGAQAIRTHGVGTALKPSIEPICFSRKPIEKGLSIAQNVLKYGTGGINIDESRVGTDKIMIRGGGNVTKDGEKTFFPSNEINEEHTGRFPANLIHDNSEEVRECFPETKSGGGLTKRKNESAMFDFWQGYEREEISDSGNASRFFKSIIYQAKASKSERNKGCDCYLTVKYNGSIIDNNKTLCKEENMVAVQLLRKVISEQELVSFNIDESGVNIMAQCHKDSLSTILTVTSRIIELKIYNLLTHSLTNESTLGVNSEMENGGSIAENVADLKRWLLTITKGKTELALGASRVVCQMLSLINEKENWKPATNFHSTVKPIALMEYLIKMVTPKGGIVLDPFAGSGSTLVAAKQNNFQYIGIELDGEYIKIAEARLK